MRAVLRNLALTAVVFQGASSAAAISAQRDQHLIETAVLANVTTSLTDRAPPSHPLYVGFDRDCGSSELAAIRNRKIDFAAMRMNDDNGPAIAKGVWMTLENRTQEIRRNLSGAVSMVDPTIADQKLGALVDQAFRYSR